jgi:chorismate mutase/prephenate dehydratase
MAEDEDVLARLRVQIDQADDDLLDVLNHRARLVEQVAAFKQAAGRAFYVPGRERAIVDRLQGRNPGPFPSVAIRPVFQEVISACLSLEKGMRVAYLGPEGTFTHQAVKRHFGTSAVTMPCGGIPAVFDEVARGAADFGVVPVENSSGGVVNHTLDTFVDSALVISAEIVVNVDQCLMARSGVTEAAIERVYSHPQGLAQCRLWLQTNLPRARLVECSSTSEAARRAAEDPQGAAIAAELAARIHRLEVLREKLQDQGHNVTRFLVIGRAGTEVPVPPSGVTDQYKSTLLLSLPDSAGALLQVLTPLRDANVNMTKIESRPSRQRAWDYVFFIDIDGHVEDERVAPALAQLASICELFRVLGSYRKADEA